MHVVAAWQQLVESSIRWRTQGDLFQLTSLLRGSRAGSTWVEVHGLLMQMEQRWLEVDVVPYNIALNAKESKDGWRQQLDLFQTMQCNGLEASQVSYCALASALLRWPAACHVTLTLQAEMLQPNIISCSTAISACEKGSQWSSAFRVFDDMKSQGLEADLITVGALITSCEKGALAMPGRLQWSQALQLSATNARNVVQLSAAVSACEKANEWQFALAIFFEETVRRYLQPDIMMCNAAISACRGHQWQRAIWLLTSIVQSLRLKRTLVTCNSCMNACSEASQWLSAFQLFADLEILQLRPDVITYNSLMSSCERAGLWQTALELMLEIPQQRLTFSSVTLGAAISACEEGAQWPLALHFLTYFPNQSLQSTVTALSSAISACEKGTRWAWALQLLHDADHFHVRPNV
ncbi:unnamed protein product, partial [Cladocopium goreaui]